MSPGPGENSHAASACLLICFRQQQVSLGKLVRKQAEERQKLREQQQQQVYKRHRAEETQQPRNNTNFLVTSSLSGREILSHSRSLDQADGRHSPTPELVEALMLAEQFQLKRIKHAINHEL